MPVKAVTIALLFYRQLQAELQLALNLNNSKQDYSTHLQLSREELQWWPTHFTHCNGRSLITKKPNVALETDASQTGCGAVWQGRTGGSWSEKLSTVDGSVPRVLNASSGTGGASMSC